MSIAYVKEVVWGVAPGTQLKEFRLTGEDLAQTTETAQSAEIRADRQIPDIIRTARQASGGLNWELSYGAIDDFLEGFAQSVWGATLALTGSIAAVTATSRFTSNTGSGGPSFVTIQVGQWIKVGGFVQAANNGYFKVTAKDTTGATHFITVSGDAALVDEAAGGNETIAGAVLFPGTTSVSFSIEKKFADTGLFDSFLGMRVASVALNVATGAIVTGSFGFSGKKGADTQVATIGTGTNAAAPANAVLNAIDHVAQIREAGVATTIDITAFTMQADNHLRVRQAVRNLDPVGVGLGVISLQGTFNAYFADRALLNKYRAFTETSLALRFTDGAGQTYIFELPAIKLTSGRAVGGGQSQDVIAEFQWQAKMDTLGHMFSFNRL